MSVAEQTTADTLELFKLSIPQKGIWAATLSDPGSAAYVTAQYSEIAGRLDEMMFERASRIVIEETEALRLRFREHADEPLQWVSPFEAWWTLPVVDLSAEPSPRVAALAWMTSHLAQPLDVTANANAFRWTLLRLGGDRFIWSFQVHHLLMDGASRNMVWRRLETVYIALAAGSALLRAEPGALRQVFADQAAYEGSAEFDADRRYFASMLARRPPRASLSSAQPTLNRAFRRRTTHLPVAAAAALRAKTLGVSVVQAVTAAAALLLRELAGDEVLLGFAVGARVSDLTRRTPAMMSNIVPMRLRVAHEATLQEVLRGTATAIRELMPHQRYPSQKLRQDLGLRPPDPDCYGVVVNFMPFDQGTLFAGIPAQTHNLSNGPIADLVIGVFDNRGQGDVRVDLNGNRDLYDGTQLQGYLDRLIALVVAIADDPAQSLGALMARVLASARAQEQRWRFWTTELDGLEPSHLPAPLLPPVGAAESTIGTRHFALSAAVLRVLQGRADALGISVAPLYLAAYFAVLRIYTGSDDLFVVFEDLCGAMATDTEQGTALLVAMRTALGAGTTLAEGAVKLSQLYQRARYAGLTETELTALSAGGTFRQECLSLRFIVAANDAERKGKETDFGHGATLTLAVCLDAHAPSFMLAYGSAALDHEMAARFAGHFQQLLSQAAAQPEAPLHALSVLSTTERDALVVWGETRADTVEHRTVLQLFEEVAHAQPEALALVAGTEQLSYRELDQWANDIAWQLRQHGVVRGQHVPLVLGRCTAAVAGALGVLKVGAAYVPLDPAWPFERRARLLECLEVRAGLGEPSDGASASITWLNPAVRHGKHFPPPPPDGIADAPAYVMFTSGSSGQPKGVEIPHRGIVRLVRGQTFARMGADEVWLHLAPPSFDASTLEIWAPLLNGGRCVLAEPGVPTPASLSTLIAREGITSAWFTASLFNTLIDEDPACLSGLAQVLVGGEPLSPRHVRLALEALPRTRLVNGYGPTENTTFTSCHVIARDDLELGRSIPIGRPLANTTVRVLDRDGNRVPIGVPGELVTGGRGVALRYVGLDEETTRRFMPDGDSAAGGALLYRTGDRVRWRDDGRLEFLGRFDDQLKINGHRIEPGEIAAVLAEHAGVRQAAVVAQRGPAGDRELVAYMVPAAGDDTPGSLVSQLKVLAAERLPAYLIPAGYVVLDRLPLKPNGKLDAERLAPLRHPSASTQSTDPAARAPGNTAVLALLSELLGQPVAHNDNLYALGADSLRLVRVVARLKSRLGLDVPIATLATRGDVADILAFCAVASNAAHAAQDLDAAPRTKVSTNRSPCSPWQIWHWRLHQFDPADPSSVIFRAYRVRGVIDVDRLELALRHLGRRHWALRCRFSGEDDAQPEMQLQPAEELRVRRAATIEAAQLEATRRAAQSTPLDLRKEIPCRLTWQPLADRPGESELWLAIHHIAFDGRSEQIFWRELQMICGNLDRQRPWDDGLPLLRASLFQLIERQRLALERQDLSALDRYWREKLAGTPERLPLSWRPHARTAANTAVMLRRVLPGTLSRDLRQFGREHRVSLAMLALAVYQALLARWSGENDLLIAADYEGRSDELEFDHIGLFTSPVALRSQLSKDAALLQMGRDNLLRLADVVTHRAPFERVIAALGTGRRRLEGIRVFFGHLQRGESPSLGNARLEEITLGHVLTGVDLRLNVEERPDGDFLTLMGASELFDRDDLLRLAAAYEDALLQLCARPDIRLAELTWQGAADRRQIAEWNQTASPFASNASLGDLLTAQAQRTPQARALEYADVTLTYAELFARAEAVAMRLKALGVGRGDRVGLYLDRHAALPECMLGILLAGGGYVPLDPQFPAERLAFMLEDAAVCSIVTRRALVPTLPAHSAPVLCLEDCAAPPTAARPGHLPATADSLAYVLYTSGSTGTPKGVEIQHRQLVNFLTSMALRPGLRASDKVLAVTSISFDIAGLEIWLPLFCGACICLAGPAEVADAALLTQALERTQATVLQTTTSTWRSLLGSGWSAGPGFKALVGGEALPIDLAELLASRCSECWNLYGPTETTIWSSAWRLTQPVDRVRVGKPIANTELHVLDDHGRPLPIGVTGELYIGGEGVARGYLNRPDLNTARFPPDPFRGAAARLYRTGDLARWLPEGNVELLGRNDAQLKVRGHRIEAGEVEAALLRLEHVSQAVVVLHQPSGHSDARLVAYLVAAPGATLPQSDALRASLRLRLADYMLPYHFVPVSILPLTPNGKIDRLRLAKLPLEHIAEIDLSGAAEASPAELDLMRQFSQSLGRPVALDSDFFEAGGDSLEVLRLTARLSRRRQLQISSGELFLHSTPRRLAARLEALQASAAQPRHLLRLRPGSGTDCLCLVHPVGGHLAPYGRLLHHLDPAIMVFGLQTGFNKEEFYESFAERCAAYVTELLANTNGTIVLAGYSLGGAIALEMAHQIQKAGRVVSHVLMLDVAVPLPPRHGWDKLRHRISELAGFSWHDRFIWLNDQLARRLRLRADVVPEFGEATDLIDTPGMRRLWQQALRWQPPYYPGKVRLVRASQNLRGYANPAGSLGWERYCSALNVTTLRCNHAQILLEPQAERVAGELHALLEVRRGITDPSHSVAKQLIS